ncbi:MAG: hypothetical protein M1817_003181 [Caeruleum heppii]|nr:MAG: hypothetical protein M1817_003181 [Caeruleum heppii]
MAEILGAVAGTAGLLHLTLKGTKLVYDLTSRYRHAFDEIDRLCGELEWLGHLLEAVQSLPGHSSSLLSSSDALGAAVSQCDQAIKDLHALLGRFIPDEPRLKREAVKSRIRKVIKDRKLQAATERLEQAKVSLLLAQTNLARWESKANGNQYPDAPLIKS